MTDQELDRLLAAAIDVNHSPEFLPRVRRRVETKRASAWWSAPRRLALGAGLAVIAVIVALLLRPESRIAAPERLPTPSASAANRGEPIVASTPVVPERRTRPPAARRTSARTESAARQRAAAVLISPDDSGGLELVIRTAREGRLRAEVLVDSRSGESGDRLPPIELAPLNIEPLPEIVPLQGDQPRRSASYRPWSYSCWQPSPRRWQPRRRSRRNRRTRPLPSRLSCRWSFKSSSRVSRAIRRSAVCRSPSA